MCAYSEEGSQGTTQVSSDTVSEICAKLVKSWCHRKWKKLGVALWSPCSA